MRKGILLTFIMVFVAVVISDAQSITNKDEIVIEGPEISIGVNRKYSYHHGENGEIVYDGVYSMNGSQEYHNIVARPYTYDYKITYNFNAQHNKTGRLHGAITSKWHYLTTYSNGKKDEYSQSLSGNFNNGLPHGEFRVKCNVSSMSANVNFNKGKLVGSYKLVGLMDGPVSISGTLDANGQLAGSWNVDQKTLTFQNGVMISEVTREFATPSRLVDLAKQYAQGKISEDELNSLHIFIREGKLQLGKYAVSAITGTKVVSWDDLGAYSFEDSYNFEHEYKYLEQLPYLTDSGVDYLAEMLTSGNYANYFYVVKSLKWNVVNYTSEGQPYISPSWHGEQRKYVDGPVKQDHGYYRIYMTEEQVARLDSLVYNKLLSSPIDFRYVLFYKNSGFDDLKYHNIKYTKFSPDDENVLYFDPEGEGIVLETYFYTKESFESCLIENGYLYFWLDIIRQYIDSPDTDERVRSIAERDFVRLQPLAEAENKKKIEIVEQFFSEHVINKTYNELQENYEFITRNYDFFKNILPITSFKAIEVVPTKYSDITFSVRGQVNVKNGNGYATFNMVAHMGYFNDIYVLELMNEFERVKNEYDLISELDAQIVEIDDKIQTAYSAVSKSGYYQYRSYMRDLNLITNHDDLQASINQRHEILALQDTTLVFVEKIGEILKNDDAMMERCEGYKDVASAYKTYITTRDLNWSPTYDFAKFEQYLADQNHLQQFIALRDTVAKNHALLQSQKAAAKNFHKFYLVYYSGCDLSWNPQKELSGLEDLISVQERCVALMSHENIAEIDKSVRKQKITDIEQILSMNTISHEAPAYTTKKETDIKPKAEHKPKGEDKPLVEAKNVEPEPKLEKELKPTTVKKQNVPNNGFRTRGLINSFELSYNAQFASDRYVSLQDIGNYPYSTVHPIEFNYLIGYRFCNWVSLSFGTGIVCDMVNLRILDYAMNSINYSGPTYSTLRIPVFLNVKTYMTDTKIQPMASLSVGGTSSSVVDFLDLENWTLSAELGVGCNVRTGNRGNLYFLLSAKMMPMPYFETYSFPSDVPGQSYTEGWYGPLETVAASIKVGFMF